MSQNKEDLKNKIFYRAAYRGTKEMDLLIHSFVKFIIDDIDDEKLEILDQFVNMNDEDLISIKNDEFSLTFNDPYMKNIVQKFKKFKL